MNDNRSYLVDRINGEGRAFYHIFARVDASSKIHIISGSEIFNGSDEGRFAAQVQYENGAIGIFSNTGKIIISSRKEDSDLEIDGKELITEFKRWKTQPEVKCESLRLPNEPLIGLRGFRKNYYLCKNSYLPV